MAEVCKAVAHGSLMGARGNSGVILSQLLRGLAERLRGHRRRRTAPTWPAALVAAGRTRPARRCVRPVEGTILTVARAAGGGRRRRADGGPATAGRGARGAPGQRRGRRPGPHARAAPGPGPGRRGRRRRRGLPPAARRAAARSIDGRPLPRAPPATTHPGPRRPDAPRPARVGDAGAASATCATRSCTSSRRPTTPSPAFKEVWAGHRRLDRGGRRRRPVELPHPHRRHRRGDRGRPRRRPAPRTSGSPTWPSRSRRSAGCARAAAAPVDDRRRRPAPRSPPWWPWPPARASAGSSAPSGSTPVRRRPVDEPVDGADPRGGRGGSARDEVVLLPNNEQHPSRSPSRSDELTDKTVRGGADRAASSRASPPCSPTTRTATRRGERRGHGGLGRAGSCRPRSPGRCATPRRRPGRSATGDWIGLSRDGVVVGRRLAGRRHLRAARPAAARRPRARHADRGRGRDARPTPAGSPSGWPSEHPDVAVEVHHGGQPLYPYLFGIE